MADLGFIPLIFWHPNTACAKGTTREARAA